MGSARGTRRVVDALTVLACRCAGALDVAAAAILLADRPGHLPVIGSSDDDARLLELFQVQESEGPSTDCSRDGMVAVDTDLRTPVAWPRFAAASVRCGFLSVCALPIRFGELFLGSLNVFIAQPVELAASEIALARAFADVAAIALVQRESSSAAQVGEERLRRAVHARIVVEQATGMLAERDRVDVDVARTRLQAFARAGGRSTAQIAAAIVAGRFPIDSLAS